MITITQNDLLALKSLLAGNPDGGQLPDDLAALDFPKLREIGGVQKSDEGLDLDYQRPHNIPDSWSYKAAVIRGETPYVGSPIGGLPDDLKGCMYYDADGVLCSTHHLPISNLDLTIRWLNEARAEDDKGRRWRDPVLTQRYDPSYEAEIIPPAYLKHSLYTMEPFAHSPIDMETQGGLIDRFRRLPHELRGLLLVGPAGSSKTALVAALIKDMITFREPRTSARSMRRKKLGIYRTRVSDYIKTNEEWDRRAWEDTSVPRPKLTPQIIEEEASEWQHRPILWLEELDKFSVTANRVKQLNSLLNAVYEREGLVIATANETLDGLRKMLDDATMRRITGDNDDQALFRTWDLYKAPATAKPATKSSKQMML